ncbi:MAG TPA: GntR family transcriptional regulator [Alphaproteobacteria bacterium]|nr:GntR family transcriptional regulator [Alphaproteobacteria bacterium]
MAQGNAIQRQTTVTLVADELRRRIMAGALAEGQQLRQEALAAELGVSRIPVREALRQLEAEGFVSIASHRGAVVSKLSPDEIVELFELRIRLETWLLSLAIPEMGESDLDRAEQALEAMISNRRIENWGELNWDFHAALYSPSGRAATLRILRRINENMDRYIRLQISLTSGQLKAHREHKQLLRFCRTRSIQRAVAALEQHIVDVRDGLIRQLREAAPAKSHARGKLMPGGSVRSAKM